MAAGLATRRLPNDVNTPARSIQPILPGAHGAPQVDPGTRRYGFDIDLDDGSVYHIDTRTERANAEPRHAR